MSFAKNLKLLRNDPETPFVGLTRIKPTIEFE